VKYKVRLHDMFRSDVDECIEWIEQAEPGLGAELAVAVDSALVTLESRPLSHSILIAEFRRLLIPRFKVVVPFLIEGDTVYVAGVVHGSRDVQSWLRRRLSPGGE
jgi:plasmid stabilization system protein ParE